MTELLSATVAKMMVNGEWVEAGDGSTIDVINPYDGSVVASVPKANRADARVAIQAAVSAMPAWADTSPDERSSLLLAGVEKVREQQKELAKTLSAEQGKPVFEAMGEIHHFLHGITFYAGLASKIRGAQVALPPDMGKHSYGLVLNRPVGVCGAIVPWNFPITLMGTKIGPALIAGNTIVVKPASSTPLTTLKIIGLFNEAGIPPGVLNCITGPGREVGEELLENPVVRRIAFTGESGTGRRVMEVAGPQFKRITLELGGSDPMIVMPDTNLKKAITGALIGRYWNAGQACLAVKRLYLHQDIHDEFLEGLVKKVSAYEVGDPSTRPEKPQVRMGPLHTAAQRDEIEEQLADAISRGGEVIVGGKRPENPDLAKGHFFEPAIVTGVPHDAKLVQDEVFGPVLPVFKVQDLDEALALANDNQYGLGSSIWTQNLTWANQAIREIQAGVTWVNQIHYGYDELPFGGVKASGLGHEHGPEAVE